MNWQFLLAEYPRSIMEDELPLIILAILERRGITTEEELAKDIRIESYKLSQILLDLKRNHLIEFGRNSVRVNSKSKVLLDRFNIPEGVIEDLLDNLLIRDNERKAYRIVIESYRENAFPQYLNSLCTMKTWETIVDKIPHSKTSGKYNADKKTGKLTLLIRDLRNWYIHAHPPANVFDNLNENIRSAIISSELEDKAIIKGRANTGKSLFWFSTLINKVLEDSKTVNSKIVNKKEKYLLDSLIILDDFQKGWEKDDWFESWCDISPNLNKEHIDANQFLVFLTECLPKSDKINLLEEVKKISLLGSRYWWIDEPANELSANFLGKLMMSSSIGDLADLTGMSIKSIQTALTVIKQKCEYILDEKAKTETEPVNNFV